jgi:hypothetical protein
MKNITGRSNIGKKGVQEFFFFHSSFFSSQAENFLNPVFNLYQSHVEDFVFAYMGESSQNNNIYAKGLWI